MTKVISVEHVTKKYDLGVIGSGTLGRDLNRWWARVRNQPDPEAKIGRKDTFALIGESILALDDVSFSVQQGETLGIIGRNGAGKSTLLKILSRVTAPTSGRVKIKGRIGSLLEVGTGFHPELTGRENIFLNGAILGMKKVEVRSKFDEIVNFSGVEQFIDTPVKRYSSGMYVRLAFAVAAHLEPEILIIDEVLAVGDVAFQKKCLGKMGEVSKEGRTVLFVSHNMDAIKTLCERCLWIKDGKLWIDGKSDDIVTIYLSDFIIDNQDSIENRVDRSGTDEVRFRSCDISNSQDGPSKINFFTGEPLFITLILESKLDTKIFIGLHVKDPLGRTITAFNSREAGFEAPVHKGLNKIILHVPVLLLLEGNFFFDGVIVETSNFRSCDRISNMASISIFPNDIFQSGASFSAYHGIVLLPHLWKVENGDTVNVSPYQRRLIGD